MDINKNFNPQNAKRINICQDCEIKYWSKRYEVSEETLLYTINKVGNNISDIERYLDA